jgi:hypothetical protein
MSYEYMKQRVNYTNVDSRAEISDCVEVLFNITVI